MDRRTPIIILAAVLIALALFLAARSCAGPVYAPTPTPTFPAPPTPMPVTINAPTVTPKATATGAPATATVAPTLVPPTLAAPSATPVPTGTPDLLGHHRVEQGETMYGIGLWWYRGKYLAWGDDVWRGICDANPQVVDCRMIYPGDVLAIPAKR